MLVLKENLLAAYKWVASFLRSDWAIADYPVRFRDQGRTVPADSTWSVQIINWWTVGGLGESKEEAYKNLSANFDAIKESRKQLPRPGTHAPIEYAATDLLEKNWAIVSQIIEEVLGFQVEEVFVSDESSLLDFSEDKDISEYQIKINRIFGVDVTHINSENIVDIAEYIAKNR
ncbi:MAG: hypothetical protein IID08_02400 [Candidatus Hydrogenedentes bacterium]|nr:hypothetical protein [Candidatus Hydrogenedentota bacterium]